MKLNLEMERGQYTQQLSDLIWVRCGNDDSLQDDYRGILTLLNDTQFRPFSERLLDFFNQLLGTRYSADEAARLLVKMCVATDVKLNRNTIVNWFSGNSKPKKGPKDRDRAFAVAFALSLSVNQTIDFFQKVMLEKAYNLRNINDFIYLFCQLREVSYSDAVRLIDKANTLFALMLRHLLVIRNSCLKTCRCWQMKQHCLNILLHIPMRFLLASQVPNLSSFVFCIKQKTI